MQTQETTLDKIRNRPRFKIFTTLTKEEYAENLKHYLVEHHAEFGGNVNKEMATICVKTVEEDYWKPNLSLRTEEEDGQVVIRGVFGPSSSVWTFFMFLYFLFTILWMTFFTMYFVESQIDSHEFPWALPASFVMLACIAATYAAARIGQNKAKDEMKMLRRFAEESTLPNEKIMDS